MFQWRASSDARCRLGGVGLGGCISGWAPPEAASVMTIWGRADYQSGIYFLMPEGREGCG